MSLRSSFNSANRHITSALVSTYKLGRCDALGGGSWQCYDFLTRRKEYEYFGMDYSTARKCLAAKIAQYTRLTGLWTWSHSNQSVVATAPSYKNNLECLANITMTPEGGSTNWTVKISFDYTDTVTCTSPWTAPINWDLVFKDLLNYSLDEPDDPFTAPDNAADFAALSDLTYDAQYFEHGMWKDADYVRNAPGGNSPRPCRLVSLSTGFRSNVVFI